MIYLCKAFKAPCWLCSKTCEGFAAACKESCKCCGTACEAISDFFGPITRGPLAGYVVGTWLVMALTIAAYVWTLGELKEGELKGACDDPKMFFYVNIGLAVVHILAARYIQWRVVSKIKAEGKDSDQMSHKDIAQTATHIALYDFGFCLYVFVFLGAFGFNCWGLTTLDDKCSGTGPGWSASGIKIVYAVIVWNYFFCWYCWQSCCGAKEARQADRLAGQPVGASA